ncbi:hypothetical protein L7F22_038995 [Adiantum nelumboides]|nr:hypothetical protein [Adiantum nelumboides]
MEMITFNAHYGYAEGLVRGYQMGLLGSQQYAALAQCETLDDLKMQLSATDYGNFLANEPSPLSTSTIAEKATGKMVQDFDYLRQNASGDLAKFLEYLTYSYMIDNVILLITGTLHERDTHELLQRCHPLGKFESMPALCVATTVEELYRSVLVETPLAPYFRDCLSAPKVLNITLNSFGTSLSKEDRARLFPSIGRLFPAGNNVLARADDIDQVKAVCDYVPEYRAFFGDVAASSDGDSPADGLEDKMFKEETRLNKIETINQFQFGAFYSWLKLKEQEIRSITWIAECIAQGVRDRISDFVNV